MKNYKLAIVFVIIFMCAISNSFWSLELNEHFLMPNLIVSNGKVAIVILNRYNLTEAEVNEIRDEVQKTYSDNIAIRNEIKSKYTSFDKKIRKLIDDSTITFFEASSFWDKILPAWVLENPDFSYMEIMEDVNDNLKNTKHLFGLASTIEYATRYISREASEDEINKLAAFEVIPEQIFCYHDLQNESDIWAMVLGDTVVNYYRELPNGYKIPFRGDGNPFWLNYLKSEPQKFSCGLDSNGIIYIVDNKGRLGFFDIPNKNYLPDFYTFQYPILVPQNNQSHSVFIKKEGQLVEYIVQIGRTTEEWNQKRIFVESFDRILYADEKSLLAFSDDKGELIYYDQQEVYKKTVNIPDYLTLRQAAYSPIDQKVYFLFVNKKTLKDIYYTMGAFSCCQVDVYQLTLDVKLEKKFIKFDKTIIISDDKNDIYHEQ